MVNRLNTNSASLIRSCFMNANPSAYCCAAGGGTSLATAAFAGAAAFADAAAAAEVPGAGAGEPVAAGGDTSRAAGDSSARGSLWQAATSTSTLRLTNRFDQRLTEFHLAITAWVKLRQRRKAPLHPLIVGAVLGSRRIHFMQFDCLFLEGEGLFLQQHVVLFQFVLREILRTLRTHQVLSQLSIEFSAFECRGRGHVGNLVIGGLRVRLERRLHRLALFGQGFLEGRDELDAHELFACGCRERQSRLCRQCPAAIRACSARRSVGGDDLLEPVIAAVQIA